MNKVTMKRKYEDALVSIAGRLVDIDFESLTVAELAICNTLASVGIIKLNTEKDVFEFNVIFD